MRYNYVTFHASSARIAKHRKKKDVTKNMYIDGVILVYITMSRIRKKIIGMSQFIM